MKLFGIRNLFLTVGIYSFAAMLLDGYNQLGVVFRNIENPVLAKQYKEYGKIGLRNISVKTRNFSFLSGLPIGLIAALLFPLLKIVFPDVAIYEAWPIFAILIFGSLISQGYIPLLMIPNQCGFPGINSFLFFLMFVTLVILNFLLVPIFGMVGSAIGTSLTFALQVAYLKILVKRKLNIII